MRARSIVMVLLAIVAASCRSTTRVPSPAGVLEAATIVKVVDGDTIEIDGEGRRATVRLIGIDTPETKRPNTPIECYGPEAQDQLNRLLPPGTEVQLEHDAERTDRYGRELAYVRRAADGLFVNLAMVRDGFAGALSIRPNVRYEPTIAQAVDDAKLSRRGLWSTCGSAHRPR